MFELQNAHDLHSFPQLPPTPLPHQKRLKQIAKQSPQSVRPIKEKLRERGGCAHLQVGALWEGEVTDLGSGEHPNIHPCRDWQTRPRLAALCYDLEANTKARPELGAPLCGLLGQPLCWLPRPGGGRDRAPRDGRGSSQPQETKVSRKPQPHPAEPDPSPKLQEPESRRSPQALLGRTRQPSHQLLPWAQDLGAELRGAAAIRPEIPDFQGARIPGSITRPSPQTTDTNRQGENGRGRTGHPPQDPRGLSKDSGADGRGLRTELWPRGRGRARTRGIPTLWGPHRVRWTWRGPTSAFAVTPLDRAPHGRETSSPPSEPLRRGHGARALLLGRNPCGAGVGDRGLGRPEDSGPRLALSPGDHRSHGLAGSAGWAGRATRRRQHLGCGRRREPFRGDHQPHRDVGQKAPSSKAPMGVGSRSPRRVQEGFREAERGELWGVGLTGVGRVRVGRIRGTKGHREGGSRSRGKQVVATG
ncbi:hypothetical protein P7K49_002201 [Saguinus oedipus]|uniref:Uncharacterized protein n=1 Tax=Saguinus oedipus TaxID=9490 RepID=A0ABQ9WGN6_SAGOE|nr:hypothetical protein P7K49_002201 [Saguinus oedipus]